MRDGDKPAVSIKVIWPTVCSVSKLIKTISEPKAAFQLTVRCCSMIVLFQHQHQQHQHHYDVSLVLYFSTIMMLAIHSSLVIVQILASSYLFVNGQWDATSDCYRVWFHARSCCFQDCQWLMPLYGQGKGLIWLAGMMPVYCLKLNCFFHFIPPSSHLSLRVCLISAPSHSMEGCILWGAIYWPLI